MTLTMMRWLRSAGRRMKKCRKRCYHSHQMCFRVLLLSQRKIFKCTRKTSANYYVLFRMLQFTSWCVEEKRVKLSSWHFLLPHKLYLILINFTSRYQLNNEFPSEGIITSLSYNSHSTPFYSVMVISFYVHDWKTFPRSLARMKWFWTLKMGSLLNSNEKKTLNWWD